MEQPQCPRCGRGPGGPGNAEDRLIEAVCDLLETDDPDEIRAMVANTIRVALATQETIKENRK